MEENPYAKHLDDRDAIDILTATSAQLRELFAVHTPEEIDHVPAPGKWSLRELMAHLADCEIVWSWRIRQVLGSDTPALQPFQQDRWADHYSAYDFPTAQLTFDTLRAWNVRLLSTVTAEDRTRPASHPERGALTLRTILETIAGHDLHHIRLLEGLRKKEAKEAVPSPS